MQCCETTELTKEYMSLEEAKTHPVAHTDIDRWLKSVDGLAKDLKALQAAKEKAKGKMTDIGKKYNPEKKPEDKPEDKDVKEKDKKSIKPEKQLELPFEKQPEIERPKKEVIKRPKKRPSFGKPEKQLKLPFNKNDDEKDEKDDNLD